MTEPLILVINSGSSSLKFAVHVAAHRRPLLAGLAERLGAAEASINLKLPDHATRPLPAPTHAAALDAVLAELSARGWLDRLGAVGHRVVHGGERLPRSVVITPEVLADIEACAPLAPLHNPPALLAIRTAMQKLPHVPHVAVPDTAFHQTMPPAAYIYALPMALYRDHHVRRYGFHGTSHRFVAAETVQMLGLDPQDHGLVTAHLGNGASATAVQDGRSVDTSMGLTPLEGLVMGTRSGDVDPGALLMIARWTGKDLDALDTMLNKQSGLLGVSELSNDCRELEHAAQAGHAGAKLALDVFVHRLARYIGGLAMSLRRLDAVVFTGGIGEHSAWVRAATISRLGVLGLALDDAANRRIGDGQSGVISTGPGPKAVVVPTNEEWMIARDSAALAARQPAEGAG